MTTRCVTRLQPAVMAGLMTLVFGLFAARAGAEVAATVDGVIAAGEYGNHTNGQNQQSTSTGTWYMAQDATNLYIGITGTNTGEGAVLYLDKNPVTPSNGGTNADGTIAGFNNYDGSSFTALQFRGDLVVYFKDGYREYRTADGAGSWSGATTAFGAYASSSGTRELSIPWSAIGGRPASFAWFGYVAYAGGGAYASVPPENPGSGGGLIIGTSAHWGRYYVVSTTSTPPFSRNCYVFNNTVDETGFNAIAVFDFTMNSTGRTITRGSGLWTIGGNLRVDAGSVLFGSAPDAANVTGDVTIGAGGTLTLSSAIGGDLNLSGNWSRSGTFNPANRAVGFNGGTAQILTGATTFEYLSLNNTVGLTLNSDATVNQTLTFTNGKITTGTNKVTIGPSGSVSTAGVGKYVVGNLKKRCTIAGGSGSQTWEVGDAGTYAPVDFSTTHGLTQLDITASTAAGDHPNIGTSALNAAKSANRYWALALAAGQSFGPSSLTFHFTPTDVDGGANTARFAVAQYDAPTWGVNGVGTRAATSTQATGVTHFSDFQVGEGLALVLTESHVDVGCNGAATGSIDLSVSGGILGYTYLWSPGGATTQDISGLAAGTYKVVVTDAASAKDSLSVTITEPPVLSLSETHVDVVCNGGATGSIDLSVSGGTPGYSYLWLPGGESAEDLSGLAAGTYTVTVTDSKGCLDSLSVTITESSSLALSETHVDVLCHGGATGSVDLSVSGGTPGYSYLWTPGGETTEDLSGLVAGTYTAMVTDSTGCTDSLRVAIAEPDSLVLTETHVNEGCHGVLGSIDLSVAGGTGPCAYLWSPGGETTQDLSGLAAGTDTVTVTDSKGCTATLSVTIAPAAVYTIMATAGLGGTITPSDTVLVPCGTDMTFTFAPDAGYQVLDVEVDAVSQGPSPNYTFANVQGDHSIRVTFDQVGATLVSLFSANPVAGGIELRWQMGDPQVFAQIVLDRAEAAEGPWTRVTGPARTEGDVTVVRDEGLTPGVAYTYRLTATTWTGLEVVLDQLSGMAGERITAFALAPVWPNPVLGMAHVEFTVPEVSQVRLSVLDIQGREIAVIMDGSYPAGKYRAVWSGETNLGLAAPAGVYFLHFRSAAGRSLTRRVVLAR